jgi:putative transcriptional regulator
MKTVKLSSDGTVIEVSAGGQTKLVVGQTDWERLKTMTEEELEANALFDLDNPPLSEEELKKLSAIPNTKQIRERLQLSQKQFAEKFHLSLRTVQDWEQGRTQPDRAAQTLLKVIELNPKAVDKVLNQEV